MGGTLGSARSREHGFSLIETTVVFALVGLMLAAATVPIRGVLGAWTLDGWSETIVTDIRAAQQLAIARRAAASIAFTNQGMSTPASYTTTVGGAVVRQQQLPTELNVPATTLQFNGLGLLTSAGTSFTLSDSTSGRTVTITVTPVTGAVTVQ